MVWRAVSVTTLSRGRITEHLNLHQQKKYRFAVRKRQRLQKKRCTDCLICITFKRRFLSRVTTILSRDIDMAILSDTSWYYVKTNA